MRRIVFHILRAFIYIVGTIVVLSLPFYFVPGLAILFVGKIPTSPYCSTWKAVADGNTKIKQAQFTEDINKKIKLLRTEGRFKQWQTPMGVYWTPDSSDSVLLSTLLAQQAREIYGDRQAGVHAGDVVLDCGAHVGTYVHTALAAGARLVVAIEPSPDAIVCLRRNFEDEVKKGRVIVYPKGVWDEEKTLTFYDNGNGAVGDSFVSHNELSKPVASIPVTTIDKIAEELGIAKVDFIKADVKGASERMVRGSALVLKRDSPRWAISTETPPEDPKALTDLLRAVVPSYQVTGGPCLYTEGEIRSDVMFYK